MEQESTMVDVYLPNGDVVVGSAEIVWTADGNEITVNAKLEPTFEGESAAGNLLEGISCIRLEHIDR